MAGSVKKQIARIIFPSLFLAAAWIHSSAAAATSPAPAPAPSAAFQGSKTAINSNKVGAIFTFLGASILGVWIPYFIPVNPEVLKFGVLFSAGLFVSMSLLELSRESYENLEQASDSDYPYGFLVVVCGIYLTWFCDLVVKMIWRKRQVVDTQSPQDESMPSLAEAVGLGVKEGAKDHEALTAIQSTASLNIIDVVLLLFALCFHAVFEGLAVGLASSVQAVWTLAASIAVNEFFEGLALGVTLRAQDPERHPLNYFAFSICASVVAPVGIAIGIILDSTTSSHAQLVASGIGMGCAAGVFLFIGLAHLIPKGMKPNPNERWWIPFLKWTVSGLAFALQACLHLWQKS